MKPPPQRPRLLITRPADEAERTAEAARQAGFEPVSAPLLLVEPLPHQLPGRHADALLFTSPRAPTVLAGLVNALAALPCYTVGPATTAAARRAGFAVKGEGAGDGNAAVELVAREGHHRILHPRGEDHVSLIVPDSVELLGFPVYRARAIPELSAAVVEQLAAGEIFAALLLSPRTAGLFADLIQRAGVPRAAVRLVTLSPNVSATAGSGWRAQEVAEAPRLDAAFAAARRLWQGGGHG